MKRGFHAITLRRDVKSETDARAKETPIGAVALGASSHRTFSPPATAISFHFRVLLISSQVWSFISEDILTTKAELPPEYVDDGAAH